MKDLIDKLYSLGIHISLVGQELKIKFNGSEINKDIIQEIKDNKQFLIHYLTELNLSDNIKNILPSRVQSCYDLSLSQKGLWLVQFIGGGNAYNMSGIYTITGTLNIEILTRAFQELINRHEILRTIFKEDTDGEIKQWIKDSSVQEFSINFHDISKESDQERIISSLTGFEIKKEFNLSSDILFRVQLLRLSADVYIITFVMHHIIGDGWSFEILIRELSVLYNSFLSGKPNPLIPLSIQYKDYVLWQNAQVTNSSYKIHSQYWIDKFKNGIPLLDISKKIRPNEYSFNGNTILIELSKERTSSVLQLTDSFQGTLFTSLLFFVKILIFKYTKNNKIMVGASFGGRNHHQLEDQIGLYVNNLPIITSLNDDLSLEDLYFVIKNEVIDLIAHQAYPLEFVLNDINYKRDKSRPGLYNIQVQFNDNEEESSEGFDGFKFEPFINSNGASIFDLSFEGKMKKNSIEISLIYNTDLFDFDEIQLMKERFLGLIDVIKTNFKDDFKIGSIDVNDMFGTYQSPDNLLFDMNENF